MKFHTVLIIYNPNSTGPSQKNAQGMKAELIAGGFKGTIRLIGTKFAGHAEEIAAEHSDESDTLILSSSGDGGYNEVVNGLIAGAGKATVAVLPSGNANDHAVTVGSDTLVSSILKGSTKDIDCLYIESTVDGKAWKRYAHSYIGFGTTPSVGRLLTTKRPGVLMEKWYVLRHIFSFHHVTLIVANKRGRYTNLIFAIIPKMSKVVRLEEDASVTDGKMEMYQTKYVTRIKVLLTLIGIGLRGVATEAQTKKIALRTVRPTLVQLDGEVSQLDGDSDVRISCVSKKVRTLR